VWAAAFAAGAGWFGWRAVRVRRPAAGAEPSGAARPARPPGGRTPLTRAGLGRDCCPYPVPHLIDCLAMIYALLAVPAAGAARHPAGGGMVAGMSGMAAGGARFPVIGLVLALFVCGYVVWLADRIQRFAAGAREAVPARAGLPALAVATAALGASTARPGRAGAQAGPASPAPGAAAGGAADAHAGHVAALLAPRAATCCKIAMGVAMGVMLIDLL
jgi:hypothetical protein